MSNNYQYGIHIPDIDEMKESISDYLTDGVVNTVFILSDEVCNLSKNDSQFLEQLRKADMLLPSNILMMRELVKSERSGIVEIDGRDMDFTGYEYNAFDEVMSIVSLSCSTVFVLTQEEHELEQCRIMLKMDAPDMNSWEKCVKDIEGMTENVINEINGIAPDILLCSFDSPLQEQWILDNKDKMNTRMILGIGPGVSKAKKNKVTISSFIRNLLSSRH